MLPLVTALLSYGGRLARYAFSSFENHTFAVYVVHRTHYLLVFLSSLLLAAKDNFLDEF